MGDPTDHPGDLGRSDLPEWVHREQARLRSGTVLALPGEGRGAAVEGDTVAAPATAGAVATGDGEPTLDPEAEALPDKVERSLGRSVMEWVFVIGGAIVIAITINFFVVQAFYIPSESMKPELAVNDRVLVNKLSNRFGDPGRGDMVVFRRPVTPGADPGQEEPDDLIKRIVGEPGDVVELIDGSVAVNGEILDEPYLPTGTVSRPLTRVSRFELSSDEYFVMGDNRSNSQDSRVFGPVTRDRIVGKAFLKFWPLRSIEFF